MRYFTNTWSGGGPYELDEFKLDGARLYANKTGTYAYYEGSNSVNFIHTTKGSLLKSYGSENHMFRTWIFCHE